MHNTKRIGYNALMMYGRMLLVMILSLYTVRVLLNVVGIEDYGIFDVIAGLVSMLAMVNSTMETATQRYYSVSLGVNQNGDVKRIFNLSLTIYVLISVVVLILGETLGLWFVNSYLQIPSDRILAANVIYQFSIASVIIAMLTVPFSAMVIAHEDIGLYSILSIVETVLKLLIVYLVSIFNTDKLIVYGALVFGVGLSKFFMYLYFSRFKYRECRFMYYWDSKLFASMLSFSGWTLFGAAAGVANNQGNNVLINIFFGPIANAARGIAFQVSNAISSFSANLFVVMRPPIIKSYAEEDYQYTMHLFYLSSKLSYFLMLLIFVPLFLETNYVLTLWLGHATEQMVLFTRLMLVYTVILSQHNPITTIVQATGRVKIYFSVVESVTLLSLPLTYVFFKLGFPAHVTLYISICVFLFAHFLRLYILKKVIVFSMREYCIKFIIPVLLVSLSSISLPLLVHYYYAPNLLRVVYVTIVVFLSIGLSIYLVGINKYERSKLHEIVNKVRMLYFKKQERV